MIPIERHQRILALVEQRGAVSINELTEILGVSHMTIRRDVSKLEEQGLLVSVSGGVRAVSRLATEPSHLVKSTLQSEEKQAIGALAASHIAKNSCIYLDAGTTTLALARAILDRDDRLVLAGAAYDGAVAWCHPVTCAAEARAVVSEASQLRAQAGRAADCSEADLAQRLRHHADLLDASLVDPLWRTFAARALQIAA